MSFTQNPSSNGCIKTYALEFYNDNKRIWEPYNSGTHTFISPNWNGSTNSFTIDPSYDSGKWSAKPYYSVIARFSVTAPETVSTKNYVFEEFEIQIWEECRMVAHLANMKLTGSIASVTPQGSSAAGTGTQSDPYRIEMWDRLTIGMTATTYNVAHPTPNAYNRCSVHTTLHHSNGDRTQVDVSKPTYLFDSTTAPTKLGMQWSPAYIPNNNILYGKDASSPPKQIVLNDYLVVRI